MSNHRSTEIDATVIDLAARRRCRWEARGLDPAAVAVRLLVETGTAPAWTVDSFDYDDDDDGGWAA
ncbi:Uncharacterised protein [Nocardia farcinica]|uniref:Uncharacterized protein n=1 Tax=Nocardia farcinica TaxID=37329 RepID=A0A449H695_NOCFR|nr:hypothetical protein [Nocardia farcinica]VFA93573.1 Uncharacterised protein [Nocardia farcinica]